MICGGNDNHQLKVNNDKVEIVDSFNFLGSLILKNGGSSGEIKRRLAMAKTSANALSTIWKDRGISKNTKIRIMNALIFPVALYGAETWAVGIADAKKIAAFGMWCWRRMLGISWKEHRTNEYVMSQVGHQTPLCDTIMRSKLQYFGHISRRAGDNLEKVITQGLMEGKRKRGRPRIRWTDGIKEATGLSLITAHRMSQNRQR
jgi:hypothetical protein